MALEELSHENLLQKPTLPKDLTDIFSKVQSLGSKLRFFSTQGTLYQKHVQCGTKGCHCAKFGDKGHGPYWYLKTTKKEIYVGKELPENFTQHRHFSKEVDQLIQEYAKIELTNDELRHLIKDFVLKAESVLSFYQESEETE